MSELKIQGPLDGEKSFLLIKNQIMSFSLWNIFLSISRAPTDNLSPLNRHLLLTLCKIDEKDLLSWLHLF